MLTTRRKKRKASSPLALRDLKVINFENLDKIERAGIRRGGPFIKMTGREIDIKDRTLPARLGSSRISSG